MFRWKFNKNKRNDCIYCRLFLKPEVIDCDRETLDRCIHMDVVSAVELCVDVLDELEKG